VAPTSLLQAKEAGIIDKMIKVKKQMVLQKLH
jgi:hypothetical protein